MGWTYWGGDITPAANNKLLVTMFYFIPRQSCYLVESGEVVVVVVGLASGARPRPCAACCMESLQPLPVAQTSPPWMGQVAVVAGAAVRVASCVVVVEAVVVVVVVAEPAAAFHQAVKTDRTAEEPLPDRSRTVAEVVVAAAAAAACTPGTSAASGAAAVGAFLPSAAVAAACACTAAWPVPASVASPSLVPASSGERVASGTASIPASSSASLPASPASGFVEGVRPPRLHGAFVPAPLL